MTILDIEGFITFCFYYQIYKCWFPRYVSEGNGKLNTFLQRFLHKAQKAFVSLQRALGNYYFFKC